MSECVRPIHTITCVREVCASPSGLGLPPEKGRCKEQPYRLGHAAGDRLGQDAAQGADAVRREVQGGARGLTRGTGAWTWRGGSHLSTPETRCCEYSGYNNRPELRKWLLQCVCFRILNYAWNPNHRRLHQNHPPEKKVKHMGLTPKIRQICNARSKSFHI